MGRLDTGFGGSFQPTVIPLCSYSLHLLLRLPHGKDQSQHQGHFCCAIEETEVEKWGHGVPSGQVTAYPGLLTTQAEWSCGQFCAGGTRDGPHST